MPVAVDYEIYPLIDALDLEEYPGAPFSDAIVDSAVGTVRDVAGWHIAPQVTETLSLNSDGGRILLLPTMRIVSVTEVRDMSDPDRPRVLTGWRKSSRLGALSLAQGWPCGFESVEVDLVHGYAECPRSLLPVLADLAGLMSVSGSVVQESSGQESVTYRATAQRSPALDLYRLRSAP